MLYMTLILVVVFFILGLIIGSFLNVVIFRFNTQRSLDGRSGCMVCQRTLLWYELIPVISFFFLRGRCKDCKTRISLQYPIVELATGFMFAGVFLKFQDVFYFNTLVFSISYAYYVTMFSILLVIAVYDLRHKIIPDTLSLFFGVFAFIGLFFFSGFIFYPHIPSISELSSGFILALPFAILWFVSRGVWMGLGDAKLALGLGFLLGFSKIASGMVVAFWLGAVIGIILLLFSKKYKTKSEIPFAPFLVVGAFIAFLFERGLFSSFPGAF